jgi:hypothetical protein
MRLPLGWGPWRVGSSQPSWVEEGPVSYWDLPVSTGGMFSEVQTLCPLARVEAKRGRRGGCSQHKCVARRGSTSDNMRMITASFPRVLPRWTGRIRTRFRLMRHESKPMSTTRNQVNTHSSCGHALLHTCERVRSSQPWRVTRGSTHIARRETQEPVLQAHRGCHDLLLP